MASADLEKVLRWEQAGGSWRVLTATPGFVEVALCTCDGLTEMARVRSQDEDLLSYVRVN